MTKLRDVIISASLLTALSLFSCGKSGSGPEEADSSTPNTNESDTVCAQNNGTSGNMFKGESFIPGFPYEMVDTPKVFPVLNDQNAFWQEPDGKYTYSFSFYNISGRDVVIEQVDFESDPSDSVKVGFYKGSLPDGATTLAAIKVAKPFPRGFRHITFHVKGIEAPETHTMEILEKKPVPEN